jgi:hypothetical protein
MNAYIYNFVLKNLSICHLIKINQVMCHNLEKKHLFDILLSVLPVQVLQFTNSKLPIYFMFSKRFGTFYQTCPLLYPQKKKLNISYLFCTQCLQSTISDDLQASGRDIQSMSAVEAPTALSLTYDNKGQQRGLQLMWTLNHNGILHITKSFYLWQR